MVREYLYELWHHWSNAASYVALAVAIVVGIIVAIAGNDPISGSLLGLLIAEISLVIAGYGAWKEVQAKLNQLKSGEVKLRDLGVEISTDMAGGFPASPARFGMLLELHNSTFEDAFLTSIDVVTLDLGRAPLADEPLKKRLLQITPGGNVEVRLPLRVPARGRVTGLAYEIHVEWRHTSEKEFANRVCDLQAYKVVLSYVFEDADSKTYPKSHQHLGSFDEYRSGRISEWMGDAHKPEFREYVEIAKRGGCVQEK